MLSYDLARELTKVGGFLLGGGAITVMDGFTVARAWPWAENYVTKHFPNLEKGTQAEIEAGKSPYYQKVAEVFNDAVNTTQPMYDTMHRAKIMQSGGGIQRAFTMFKTVPLQQYNTLRRAFGELQEAKNGGSQEQKRTAARTAANAVTATLASAAGLELVELLNQLWKNGAKGYKDDDDEMTAESVVKQVGVRMFGDLAGVTVGGTELAELLENIFLGEKWYGIEIPGGEQLNDVIDTLSGTINSISKIITDGIDLADNGGDLGEYLKKNAPDYAGGIKNLAEKTALYIGGLPVENIEKYLKGTIRAAAPEVYTYLEDRFDTADKTGLKGLSSKQLSIRTEDILKNRGIDAGSAETLAGLYESGHKEAVPSDTPKSVSVNSEDRTLSASEGQRFDDAWKKAVNGTLDRLVGLKGFKSADKEGQAKMLDRLYDYAAEKGKAAVFKDFELSDFAQKAEKSPLSLAEHIEFSYRVSQIEADKDANGNSVSGSKKEKVLAAIVAMDIPDEQKDVLYLMQGYSEKTINEAPWRGEKTLGLPKLPELKKLELPKLELPALELPR